MTLTRTDTSYRKMFVWFFRTYRLQILLLETLLKRELSLRKVAAALSSSTVFRHKKKSRDFLKKFSRTKKEFLSNSSSRSTQLLVLKCSYQWCFFCNQVFHVVRTSTDTNATTRSISSKTPIPLTSPEQTRRSGWLPLRVLLVSLVPSARWIWLELTAHSRHSTSTQSRRKFSFLWLQIGSPLHQEQTMAPLLTKKLSRELKTFLWPTLNQTNYLKSTRSSVQKNSTLWLNQARTKFLQVMLFASQTPCRKAPLWSCQQIRTHQLSRWFPRLRSTLTKLVVRD